MDESKQQKPLFVDYGYFYASHEDRLKYKDEYKCLSVFRNNQPVVIEMNQTTGELYISKPNNDKFKMTPQFTVKEEWIYKYSEFTIKMFDNNKQQVNDISLLRKIKTLIQEHIINEFSTDRDKSSPGITISCDYCGNFACDINTCKFVPTGIKDNYTQLIRSGITFGDNAEHHKDLSRFEDAKLNDEDLYTHSLHRPANLSSFYMFPNGTRFNILPDRNINGKPLNEDYVICSRNISTSILNPIFIKFPIKKIWLVKR